MSDGKSNTLHDNAIGWIILAIIFFLILLLVWYFMQDQIKDAIRWIRYAEIWFLSLFVDESYTITIGDEDISPVAEMGFIREIPASQLSTEALGVITELALAPYRLAATVVLGAMGLWALLYGPGTQYRRKFNIDGLISAQANNFPVIAPFVKFNPGTLPPRPPGTPVPADLPLFAEALGPEEWVAYNEIPVPDGQMNEDVTYIAFAKQLGKRWQGPLKLEPYKQVLLAAFCLKASRKRSEADAMLGRIAQCWSDKTGLQLGKDKALLKDARKVLRNKALAANTLAKCNQHAFQTTAMIRALLNAREEGGVLAPAQFVWLRAYDRTLWYPLNNLGRQAYHMEALGAMAHFKAERRTARPIPKPKVDEAVQSITSYMSSARARPIPQLDYSKSKRRGVKKPSAGVKKPAA